jgi:hypothetical protein
MVGRGEVTIVMVVRQMIMMIMVAMMVINDGYS